MEALVLVALVLGGLCLREWWIGPPADDDLVAVEAGVTGRDIRYIGSKGGVRHLYFSVEGVPFWFTSSRGQPAHDLLEDEIREGRRVRVTYDGRRPEGDRRAWAVAADGRELLSVSEMRAWDDGNRRWMLVMSLLLLAFGIVFGLVFVLPAPGTAGRGGGRAAPL